MKAIIIYNTRSGNTKELATEMKEVLEKNGYQGETLRDKEIKSKVKSDAEFFAPYDLICLGSCTHAGGPAFTFNRFLRLFEDKNLENKKLICFSTSGDETMWQKTCKKIQEKVPELEHIGDIGCPQRKTDSAIQDFENLIKSIN